MGIEPTSEAWEASILPLYDARSVTELSRLYTSRPPTVPACFRYRPVFKLCEELHGRFEILVRNVWVS
jgi:hypothetical protein